MLTMQFESTLAGVREARAELDRFEVLLTGERDQRERAEAPAAALVEVVAVYKRCVVNGRSRELLEMLPGEEPGLTPREIAEELAPDAHGETLTKDSVRAILRNVARAETSLLEDGLIGDHVIVKNFDGYAREGAGRYSLRAEDREALDRYLGR